MVHKHYARRNKRPRRKLHPDVELEANLASRPIVQSEPSLRGAGVVTPPRKVRHTRPKHVRRNQGYYAKNGAFIPFNEAPFIEFTKDVGSPRVRQARQVTQGKVNVQTNRDLALMATMRHDHDYTTH